MEILKIITISESMLTREGKREEEKKREKEEKGIGKREGERGEGKNEGKYYQNEGKHTVVAEGGRKHFIVSVSRHISHFSYTILSSSLSSSSSGSSYFQVLLNKKKDKAGRCDFHSVLFNNYLI